MFMKMFNIKNLRSFLCILFCFVVVFSINSSIMFVNAAGYYAPKSYVLPKVKGQGSTKSMEYYTSITWQPSRQYAISHGTSYNGTKYNTYTDKKTKIRKVGDCYCAAIGTYFSRGVYKGGTIGSCYTVYLDTGKTFNIIWTDTKADQHTDPTYHLYHTGGYDRGIYYQGDLSIVEFVAEHGYNPSVVNPIFKGNIVKVVPRGNNPNALGEASITTGEKTNTYKIMEALPEYPDSFVYVETDEESFNYKVKKEIKKTKKEWIEVGDKFHNIEFGDYSEDTFDRSFLPEIYTSVAEGSLGTSTGDGSHKGKLGYPTSYRTISAGFPNYSSGRYHGGVDFPCPTGTEVRAAEAGTVTTVKALYYSYGHYIIIDHGNGLATLYAHNSKLLVSIGQHVKRGQVIAKSGSTGNSTGPHCHFEVRVNGVRKQPLNYL